ncbi:unnamed protein product [Brassica oleracea]|uniref:(rape) hypothetical protein n=1 Tax=Brassica napus TaxID=3708 RepID=A0A816R7S2_BRANA|nr:unnamed protein product [Brassica napus]
MFVARCGGYELLAQHSRSDLASLAITSKSHRSLVASTELCPVPSMKMARASASVSLVDEGWGIAQTGQTQKRCSIQTLKLGSHAWLPYYVETKTYALDI